MPPEDRSIDIVLTLLRMALSLLKEADEPTATERLESAINALQKQTASKRAKIK